MDDLTFEFNAMITDSVSAIKIGKDEMRISFSIPHTDIAKAIDLTFAQERVLKVTVEVQPDDSEFDLA